MAAKYIWSAYIQTVGVSVEGREQSTVLSRDYFVSGDYFRSWLPLFLITNLFCEFVLYLNRFFFSVDDWSFLVIVFRVFNYVLRFHLRTRQIILVDETFRLASLLYQGPHLHASRANPGQARGTSVIRLLLWDFYNWFRESPSFVKRPQIDIDIFPLYFEVASQTQPALSPTRPSYWANSRSLFISSSYIHNT